MTGILLHRAALGLGLGLGLLIAAALPLRAEIDITPVETPGGFTAWLVQEDSIPFVALDIHFRGGASIEDPAQAGVVNLMTGLLGEGAGDLDAQAFAEAREALAARISFSAGRDTVSLSARFLTDNRDAAAELIRLALHEPRFDADAVERVRRQVLSSLRRDAVDPNAIAGREFARLAFGDHPYGRHPDGTPESVAALDGDALRAAHRAAITRDRVYIGAAGDISPDDLAALVDHLLADLPEAEVPLPERTPFQAEPGVHAVAFDGPQTVIAFGHAGIERDDPEFLAAFVVNEVFGGGRFGTRLMRSLREERGLTYGVGSFLSSGALGESYQGRVSTDPQHVPQVLDILRAEWAAMAADGITEDEAERVRTFLTGAYPLRFDGNAAIASIMASMQFQGFDIDYVNRRNDMVNALTPDELNAMAARLYDPEALVFVMVGDSGAEHD
ncbi:MAG: insulinase family protein [Rhodobacteraceae bacterium]|nr:insulinase family protein [Paracoccaceae bacterium]